jgi:hypothetical protein
MSVLHPDDTPRHYDDPKAVNGVYADADLLDGEVLLSDVEPDAPKQNPETPSIEDFTLAQAMRAARSAPRQTLSALVDVTRTRRPSYVPPLPQDDATEALPVDWEAEETRVNVWVEFAVLFARVVAFLLAWRGTSIMALAEVRTEETALTAGVPYLIAAFLLWLAAELVGLLGRRGNIQAPDSNTAPVSRWTSSLMISRAMLMAFGIVLTALTWEWNGNNQFTWQGFIAWVGSITVWAFALASPDWHLGRAWASTWAGWRHGLRSNRWGLLTLVCIIAFGAYFRLQSLEATPPEMTSDHVEKLLDSQRVANGETNVFFANNGGREPTQMYLMALLTQLPGIDMNFTALKLLSALEGILLLPLIYWLGREVVGREDRRLGTLVGLAAAALVAASYWHVALSRLGLRIVLTTLVASALLVFLSRAIRHNRRADYLKAGLVLGFGLYMYQAVRMLPVVVLVAVGLAVLFKARTMRERGRFIGNLTALVLMSAVIFVPMFRYSVEHPEEFWRRTTGRLLGDSIIETTGEDGVVTRREASISERIEAFGENVPIIASNIRNALLMFNWKGDVAWINGAPNRPEMDPVAGALLIVGLAAWAAMMIRRRDLVLWLMPLVVFIMLLPSALSIAYPIENPSATRTSGALPVVYMMAALPLALVGRSLIRLLGRQVGIVLSVVLIGGVMVVSYTANAETYLVDFQESYLVSSLPYSEVGGVLHDFAQGEGSYGNAFMIAFPYWWDHRALGIEGGAIDWPNGVISISALPDFLLGASSRSGPYQLQPDKPLLFFLSPQDHEGVAQLMLWFPDGVVEDVQSYQPEDMYRLYRVPPLGLQGWVDWFNDVTQTQG